MKFPHHLLIFTMMAASAQAEPYDDCSTEDTAQYPTRPVYPTNPGNSSSGLITDACNIGYASENGGTTGGGSAAPMTITSLEELEACATKGSSVCLVSGEITGSKDILVAADTTIAGAAGSVLNGIGFRIANTKNVILRNLKISKVTAAVGDAIGIRGSTNVWIDHCDLSSDMTSPPDFYDGLCDITRASNYVTVSNSYLHDHDKASLVGHNDNNTEQDTGQLIITYANNFFENIGTRGPSIRFGTVHIFNHYGKTAESGVNTRMGAQVLIESSVFSGVPKAIMSDFSDIVGYATVNDVDLGDGTNSAETSTLTTVPYQYELLGSGNVVASVMATVGQTLAF